MGENEGNVKGSAGKRRKKLGYKEWWDRGCTKEKRKLVRTYKKWKSGKMNREDYKEEKKGVKVFMKEKIKKKKEEEEEELRNLKSETEVWRYINKRRGRKEWKIIYPEKNYFMKSYFRKSYFMKLLEGREKEEHDKKEEEKKPENEEEKKKEAEGESKALERKEIRRAVNSMKKRKAAGVDEIPMEAWMYGEEEWKRVEWKRGY